MANNGIGGGNMPRKETAMDDILRKVGSLSSRATVLANDLNVKLSPILSEDNTAPGIGIPEPTNYPPLFCALKLKFDEISSALDQIELVIDRTELS